MIKVDLITGFLGSGKTTFIKKYAKHWIDAGEKVGILENDYGAVNVDMLLLNELRSDRCELEMVAGACDADCHKRRFKTKLISMGMTGYNRVIIEPSGIFDVDEFFDSLREEPLERWYEIGSVITVVDARLEDDLSEDGDFYLASQIANAGAIVLSKTSLATDEQKADTVRHLVKASESAGLSKDIARIIVDKDWDKFNDEDFNSLAKSGYALNSYVKLKNSHDNEYSTKYYLEIPMTRSIITEKINTLIKDESFGHILRVKGFFMEEGIWYQVNATRKEVDISQCRVGQEVFIVIGENLDDNKVDDFVKG